MKTAIFVYGTLMRGYGNHKIISERGTSDFLGEQKTVNEYFFASRGIPFLIRRSQQVSSISSHSYHDHFLLDLLAKVKGEVWNVDEETLARMDQLEGHPNMYKRETLEVTSGRCQAYFYQRTIDCDLPSDNGHHSYTSSRSRQEESS